MEKNFHLRLSLGFHTIIPVWWRKFWDCLLTVTITAWVWASMSTPFYRLYSRVFVLHWQVTFVYFWRCLRGCQSETPQRVEEWLAQHTASRGSWTFFQMLFWPRISAFPSVPSSVLFSLGHLWHRSIFFPLYPVQCDNTAPPVWSGCFYIRSLFIYIAIWLGKHNTVCSSKVYPFASF